MQVHAGDKTQNDLYENFHLEEEYFPSNEIEHFSEKDEESKSKESVSTKTTVVK